jgi:aminodeoxychorismate synthase component I
MSFKTTSPCTALFLNSKGGWLPEKENSFILFREPSFFLLSDGQSLKVNLQGRVMTLNRDPLSVLEGYLSEGYFAVGYIGYEYARFTEEGFIPERRKEGKMFPDMYFHFFKEADVVSGDIEDLKFHLPALTQRYYDSLPHGDEPTKRFYSNMSRDEYRDMVIDAKNYIASGDVYQVNLSQRFTLPFTSSPLSCFLNLYDVQPVPYGCYIDFGEFSLVSGSMELFLRKTGRELVSRPIKGTRRRGLTIEADEILRAELVSSEKERAENLMIVDLMRNDLGRICEYGTVKVNKLFNVESYSTLHQMVSEVEGNLSGDVGITDILRSVFPPGSVTGAPKRRVLEVIDELEPHFRGPYCGAIGIFYPNRDFILSVAIRILLIREGVGTLWVGSGIVWDSDPEKEFEETILKAMATKKALGMME